MIRLLRRPRPRPAAPRADAPVPLTSSTDGHTHLIPAAGYDRTLAARASTYPTLCGRDVLAAALTTPPGPPCPDCRETLTGIAVQAKRDAVPGTVIPR